jgi:hypothetical protein
MPTPAELSKIADDARMKAQRKAEEEAARQRAAREAQRNHLLNTYVPGVIALIDKGVEAAAHKGNKAYTYREQTAERDRDIYDPVFLELLSHYQQRGFWAEISHNPGSEWSGLMDPSLVPTGIDHRTLDLRWNDDQD